MLELAKSRPLPLSIEILKNGEALLKSIRDGPLLVEKFWNWRHKTMARRGNFKISSSREIEINIFNTN